ncbi:aminopeptidase [Streptomyces sp. TRM 70361]|uniref:aminopeptidase n=1 Tax=Streptomyces sp. TRM 70361 TaxID=3116553 RepID=UPI002E7ACAC6|nr:aminopeptidase [Streptomyces sp. TRM 70361]MEE1937995.1 aminopeptidase [Streptomyces sp. TRM 70361]
MKKALRALLALLVLAGAAVAGGAPATADGGPRGERSTDIADRLRAVPGLRLVEEEPVDGHRFLVLEYRQPVDHRRPWKGTFQQRLTVLHKGENRPTVFHTSGYGLGTGPARSEPARLLDGNQVSMEYRFFASSRPRPADWSKLDIWQGASDQHRIFRALRRVYGGTWISTGTSKGGMAAVYYRRFYPRDMDGTVAYVAPNDVIDAEDSAYDDFFANVGPEECRDRLNAVQREVFLRREELVARYEERTRAAGGTFEVVGGADRAFESAGLDLVWAWWQYNGEWQCPWIPEPSADTGELYDFLDETADLSFYTDQGLDYYTPYHYQAGTELGSPSFGTPHLAGLLRHPDVHRPRSRVPREIPMRFHKWAMDDIDWWVRTRAERMLFVYGENDPWSAERFRTDPGCADCHVLVAPAAHHGANIGMLAEDDRATATGALLEWAGLGTGDTGRPGTQRAEPYAPLAPYDARLDRPDPAERRMMRP